MPSSATSTKAYTLHGARFLTNWRVSMARSLTSVSPERCTSKLCAESVRIVPRQMYLLIRTANSGARARTIKLNAIPLTRELATSVPQSQRGGSLLVVHGIPGQRPRSSRRLRNRRTGRHLPTDHMTATLAERPFFLASFQGARFCCSRGDVATWRLKP